MSRTGEGGGGTVALTRGLDAVRLLAEDGPLSASELSERLNIRREAADRIVSTLLSLGFIKETGGLGRYLPGPVVHTLVSRYLESLPAIASVKPVLHGVADGHGLVLSLVVEANGKALCLMQTGNAGSGQWGKAQRFVPMAESAAGRVMRSLYDEGWTGDAREKETLSQDGYLVIGEANHPGTLAMPFWLGETPAVLEARLQPNIDAESLSEIAEDLRAATSLVRQRLLNSGIRAIDL